MFTSVMKKIRKYVGWELVESLNFSKKDLSSLRSYIHLHVRKTRLMYLFNLFIMFFEEAFYFLNKLSKSTFMEFKAPILKNFGFPWFLSRSPKWAPKTRFNNNNSSTSSKRCLAVSNVIIFICYPKSILLL